MSIRTSWVRLSSVLRGWNTRGSTERNGAGWCKATGVVRSGEVGARRSGAVRLGVGRSGVGRGCARRSGAGQRRVGRGGAGWGGAERAVRVGLGGAKRRKRGAALRGGAGRSRSARGGGRCWAELRDWAGRDGATEADQGRAMFCRAVRGAASRQGPRR